MNVVIKQLIYMFSHIMGLISSYPGLRLTFSDRDWSCENNEGLSSSSSSSSSSR